MQRAWHSPNTLPTMIHNHSFCIVTCHTPSIDTGPITTKGGRRGHDRMVVELQLTMQSVPNTTNVVSSNPAQAIHHYVIKFVSDLRQVGDFLRALRFPPQIKLKAC